MERERYLSIPHMVFSNIYIYIADDWLTSYLSALLVV
jgi:hypothetical protein